MCGILFVYNPSNDQSILNFSSRLDSLKPRGPDEYNVVTGDKFMMGHTRNCITNPMKGRQPIQTNEWVIVHNGEIYNGMNNKESDSYHILSVIKEQGPLNAPKYLDGIFAYVAYNIQTNTFYAARDPVGVIPLYVAYENSLIWFSNEAKALKGLSPQCVSPGSILSNGSIKLSKYTETYSIGTQISSTGILKRLLEEACQKRLKIDVPWGLLLSGGLDSSIIASVVASSNLGRVKWKDLHTFSIGLDGSDDLRYARKVAHSIGSWHHEYIYTIDEGIDALRQTIYALETYDVTTIRAGVPMFLIGKYAKKCGIKVLFSGEGADELFGGYLYNKWCPNEEEMAAECVRKMERLHQYDCLRANKSLACHGIECRVPFLDTKVVHFAMNELSPQCKLSTTHPGGQKQTKWFLRDEFKGLVHEDIRTREKEQFSDGVGNAWIDALKSYAENKVSNFQDAAKLYSFQTPQTKEAMLYRNIFTDLFGANQDDHVFYTNDSVACSSEEGLKWNKDFSKDPSAKNLL